MTEKFENLDNWEDVPKAKGGRKLIDAASLNPTGVMSIAHNVTVQMGNPIGVKVQRMLQENMFFVRITPAKNDPTSRTITYAEKGCSAVLVAKSLIMPEIKEFLPLYLELVRVNESEMVFVGKLEKKE